MPRECCCSGGRCGGVQISGLSRREFIGAFASGAGAAALAGELAWAKEPGPGGAGVTSPKPTKAAYPMTPPRVYRGKHLEAVGMPIGGIGTGSIWLDGQGRLGTWQIFNNLSEPRIPDSFFAVRARSGGGEAVTRVLQSVAEPGFKRVESLEYEGGYPIARLKFQDPALPVSVVLEAFNPMIPLDAANSSIPCAIFRFTARNPGNSDAEVTLLGSLQNAVGSEGADGIRDVRFAGYGRNENRVVRERDFSSVAMTKSPDPVAAGPVKVRKAGQEVAGPEMLWLAGMGDLTPQAAEQLARIARDGGVALVDGLQPSFFTTLAVLRDPKGDMSALATVFEDFEKKDYAGWTISGEAFGKGPSHGTEAGQQPVSGFAGRGLVNTFIAGDGPQGLATSKPFKIARRYIGFLIGGGNHPGKTCINLRVDGRVVRTTTGKDQESLEPANWDVSDLKGKQAVIEIVDKDSVAWGHINIDQIVFSDIPPESLLQKGTAIHSVAKAIGIQFSGAEEASLASPAWIQVKNYTRLRGFQDGQNGYRVRKAAEDGAPLIVDGPLGKGRIILVLAPGLPWSEGSSLLSELRGKPLGPGEQIVPGSPGWGSMALTVLDPDAAAHPGWTRANDLATWVADLSRAGTPPAIADSVPGETLNGALAVPFTLKPGEERTVAFVIAWHFPNVQRFQHSGNLYSRRWSDALGVARYVAENIGPLWDRTRLYHETLYQSNLPEEFLDAMTSQSVIFRGPTCWWSEDGYFGGFEGSYGCCPLNCTHVWNYAQSHARLFPEVGRNMRISNFLTFLHADGETSHREHAVHEAFIDGHCACIAAALREYQLSPDRSFLEKIWPGVKKAVDWLIARIDKDRDGIPAGHQWNTYDTAVSGANTFIGSQYLAALAAGERLAKVMNDAESVARWRTVREAGMKNQNEKLFNGEYYIQIPDGKPAADYNNGCHADQLLGQWWAHMIDLGYLYPRDRVRGALEAVMRHNFRTDFHGFKQDPRRYIPDDEGGLVICTWPHNDRPKQFILYADEVWTGIEYAAAGAMVFEGLVDEARKIVRMARSRYDGRRRDGLNSGPGGNPYNELECGKFYARAMSSWSLLIASQGLVLEGPRGILGFKPRWQPEDHRSFFTAAEAWGLFVQKREAKKQTERIEVRHGTLRLKELVFELPPDAANVTATATAGGKPMGVVVKHDGAELRLVLEKECLVPEGDAIQSTIQW
jgi:non-lysosomal glucosylceramidase